MGRDKPESCEFPSLDSCHNAVHSAPMSRNPPLAECHLYTRVIARVIMLSENCDNDHMLAVLCIFSVPKEVDYFPIWVSIFPWKASSIEQSRATQTD